MAGTLAEKVWESHVVRRGEGEPGDLPGRHRAGAGVGVHVAVQDRLAVTRADVVRLRCEVAVRG